MESDDISITVRAGFFRRNLELSVPKPVQVDTSGFIKQGLSIDLDLFSTKLVERGIFNVEDFISTQEKNVRRVIDNLFL